MVEAATFTSPFASIRCANKRQKCPHRYPQIDSAYSLARYYPSLPLRLGSCSPLPRLRGERFARHWHDILRLDVAGFAEAVFADRDLADAVATHKSVFSAEEAADREIIDYEAAVNGHLHLVPDGDAMEALENDYGRMVDDGLLLEDAEPFATLLRRCAELAERVNSAAKLVEPK